MSSLSSPIGAPFVELPTVDSTNNYAMGLVRAGMAHHGMAVFAREQTQGKGQRNKSWASEKDQNIALSLILEPDPPLPFLLSMTIALGLHACFLRYVPEELTIKWPNDLYWRDRKAAGILIENSWQGGQWRFAVAGIGVNINQTSFGTLGNRAVSLKQITGKTFDTGQLARELCLHVNTAYDQLLTDPDAIAPAYNALLYKKNEYVRFKKGSRIFDARVQEVTSAGQLVVQHGVEERFEVGDVEWMPGSQ